VFSLLVIPPVVALLLTNRPGRRLALGWLCAAVGALVGILASVGMDLPAGPSIIAALVALLLVVTIAVKVRRAL